MRRSIPTVLVLLLTITTLIGFGILRPTTAAAKSFVIEETDVLINLNDVIDGYQSLKTARELDRASRDGSSIVLMINSPGGYVFAGRLILDAMKMARKRGSRIRCLVPFLAASMAFQIYAMCDERYAMEHALLLWHPPRISGQSMTADRLEYAIARLRAIELEFIPALLEKLNIPEDIFFYHYDRETLWSATELKRVLPDFLELVDDVEGMPDKVDLYR